MPNMTNPLIDDLLEATFDKEPDAVRNDRTGCYVGHKGVWISSALIAELCDQAFELGKEFGES